MSVTVGPGAIDVVAGDLLCTTGFGGIREVALLRATQILVKILKWCGLDFGPP